LANIARADGACAVGTGFATLARTARLTFAATAIHARFDSILDAIHARRGSARVHRANVTWALRVSARVIAFDAFASVRPSGIAAYFGRLRTLHGTIHICCGRFVNDIAAIARIDGTDLVVVLDVGVVGLRRGGAITVAYQYLAIVRGLLVGWQCQTLDSIDHGARAIGLARGNDTELTRCRTIAVRRASAHAAAAAHAASACSSTGTAFTGSTCISARRSVFDLAFVAATKGGSRKQWQSEARK